MLDAPSRADSKRVVQGRTGGRQIEKVPALFVSLLKDEGKVPPFPRPHDTTLFGYRAPGLQEMVNQEWVVEWGLQGRVGAFGFNPVVGLASFRDRYDEHTTSDVREILCITGSRRAVIDLFLWLRADAARVKRRLMGSFDPDNAGMVALLKRLGGIPTRVVFEDSHE